jgi:hypothetical protein
MPPVASENLLILVEKGMPQPTDDPLSVLFDNPKDPKSFQTLLFLNRTLSHEQWDDLYLPFSVYHQVLESRTNGCVLFLHHLPHVLKVGLHSVTGPLKFKKDNLLHFPVDDPTV